MPFFNRLVGIIDRHTIDKLAVEANIPTVGISTDKVREAIIKADNNGTGEHSNDIRMFLLNYVRNIL